MSRRRKQDQELWEKVKATVKPITSNRAGFGDLLGDREAEKPAPKSSVPFPKPRRLERISVAEPPVQMHLAPKPRVLDPAISRKIAKGRIAIEGRIDLHGLTQVEAHDRLWRFLENAFHDGKRTVLVITGKGRMGEGILKQSVPRWLEGESFRKFAGGCQEAHISHGGSGALYVRIRKNSGGKPQ